MYNIKNELEKIKKDCSISNWNGYQEVPVSQKTLDNTNKIINLLITNHKNITLPDISPEPDGEIGLLWSNKQNNIEKQLSISIGEDNNIPYAWLDANKNGKLKSGHGVFDVDFYSKLEYLPEKMIGVLYNIFL